MKGVTDRGNLKADWIEENEQLFRNVYDGLRKTAPDGIRCATFKVEGRESFVDVASIENDGPNPLPAVAGIPSLFRGHSGAL